MADLLSLKKVRAGIKGSLTRMENFIIANHNKTDEISIDELKVRIDTVQGLRVQFLDAEARMFVIDPDIESKMEEFESKYYLVSGKLNKWIRKLTQNEHSAGKFDESILNVTQPQSAEIKLKKLSIPPFSGEYTEWPSFYDLYNTLIHSKDYPAVQKFQYLKSLLIGEAAQLIRYITVTEANYYEAFSKLVERYDRKKYIVNAFVRTFMDQPSINQASSTSIRKLRDTSDEVLRGLKALHTKAETRDSWLIYILIKKLDQETRMLWAQESTATEYPTTKEFFDFLNKRCDALESMSSYTRAKPVAARSLVTATETIDLKKGTWSCPICKGETHLLFECKEFAKMSLASRKGVIATDRRCFNCLHKGHSVYNCHARNRCKLCHRKHHTLLHEDAPHVNAASHATSLEGSSKEVKPSTSQTGEPETQVYQTSMIYTMQAMLPTAIVRVKDINGEFRLCRALLDSASQVTFITDACVQKLGLKIGNGRVMVSGLGQSKLGRTKGVTQLEIVPRSNTEPGLNVQAYVVPKITTLQPASKIGCADLDRLKSMNLADPKFYEGGNIDLLLGVEVFFAVMEDQQFSLSPRLVVQKTRFGWVIGGHVAVDSNKSEVVNFNVTMEVDSPLRKFWEIESIPTKSDLTEEKVFSVRTLLDSIQKHKRHTSSSIGNSIEYDTPRVTRASSSLMAKSRTSIKKSNKESPVMANLEKLAKTPKSNIFETIEHVSDMVAVEDRIIKSIRKHRRSNTIIDTLASEKKNVKFHSPANMEVCTFDIDIKMQSDRKGKKRLRSLSNAETEKDKVKLKNTMTPEKKVEKTKTPRSRKKMPNFTEIHQRQFDKMESITEHAARKAERAKILHRSPKTIAKMETVDIEEPETVIVCEPEPEIMSPDESSIIRQSEPEVLQESKVEVLEAPETEVVQQLEDTVVQEPVAVIMLEPELNVANNTELINEEPEPMLVFEPEAENENLDDIEPPSDATSSTISAVVQSPFVADNLHFKQLISKSNLSPMTEHEKHRASSLVGRSPFDVVKLESVSFQPKIPLIQKRPIAISRIPGKMKLAEKNLTLNRLKIPEPDYSNEKLSPLARWNLVVKIKQHFQKRWQRDYLTSLQRRERWRTKSNNIVVGDVVLISDEYPSTSWKLGRVMEIHPGADGKVRVVTVKAANGLLKRPIHKLCRLPVQDIESSDSRPAECSISCGSETSAERK